MAEDPVGLSFRVLASHTLYNWGSPVGERRGQTQLTHTVSSMPGQQGPDTGPEEMYLSHTGVRDRTATTGAQCEWSAGATFSIILFDLHNTDTGTEAQKCHTAKNQ